MVGTLSLALLALAVIGLYVFKLAGRWRGIYIGTALAALYLNCFVAVIQSFQKIPAVNALAPTQPDASRCSHPAKTIPQRKLSR